MWRLTPCLLLTVAWISPPADVRKDIVWQHQFDQALKLAKETGKPLLIDFWASWCGPCKRMDTEVWSDSALRVMAERYIFASIDVDADKTTESHYLVHAIPTIVVADPWGHTVQRHEGYASGPEVLDMLKQLPSDYGEVKQWFEILEQDEKNTKALIRIGQFYAQRHAFHLSTEFYGHALKTGAGKEDATLREDLILASAINQYHDGSIDDARKRLDSCLKEFPNGHRQAETLEALVAVQLKQRKKADAEKTLQELQRRFPDSRITASAAAMLADAKK